LLLTFAFALVSVFDFALDSVSGFASTTKRHARPWEERRFSAA
jgi:hypothetical protein